MKLAVYVAGLLGIILFTVLVIRSDVPGMLQTAAQGGWQLLWLVPYRTVTFFLYALGWRILLRPYDPERRAGTGYLLWVTTVREAIDRLLPVASVGGAVAGVRLLGWRGIRASSAGATVIVEILLVLTTSWLFAVVGVAVLANINGTTNHRVVLALLLSLPVPVVLAKLLGSGKLFARMQDWIIRFAGFAALVSGAAALDQALTASLRRRGALLSAGTLHFAALVSGAFEIWFALQLFGHPVSFAGASLLESMIQSFRHVAFMVPASLGVQETVLVVFGHSLGIGAETAIAVSLVKRFREVTYGVVSLASWQWAEGRRLRAPAQKPS